MEAFESIVHSLGEVSKLYSMAGGKLKMEKQLLLSPCSLYVSPGCDKTGRGRQKHSYLMKAVLQHAVVLRF